MKRTKILKGSKLQQRRDSNPGYLDWESGILKLSSALHTIVSFTTPVTHSDIDVAGIMVRHLSCKLGNFLTRSIVDFVFVDSV